MRTRRTFQPMLDVLSSRIAPSAVAVGPQVAFTGAGGSTGHSLPTVQADDSSMPETGVMTPLIIGPVPSVPPPTLVC
jgi:hypothetical protein